MTSLTYELLSYRTLAIRRRAGATNVFSGSAQAEGRLLFKSGHCSRAAFVKLSMLMSAACGAKLLDSWSSGGSYVFRSP